MKRSDLTETERARISASFHEAGHAVAAVLAGGRLTEVKLNASGDSLGACTYEGLTVEGDHAVTYAGPWCEARWTHGPGLQLADIRSVIRSNPSDGDELALAASALPRHTERDLETCWPAITTLAKALYFDGTLTHAAVTAALGLPESGGERSMAANMIRAGHAPGTYTVTSPA